MASLLEPFAMELYRRHLRGETVQQLAGELGIPVERVEQRIRAAAFYLKGEKAQISLVGLASNVKGELVG